MIQDKNKHKEHQILGLQEAVLHERQKLAEKTAATSKYEQAVSGQILQLKASISKLESQAKDRRKQAS